MPTLTFFNLGNADTCRIDLADGRKMLVDYAATRSEDEDDKRADLPGLLREDLNEVDRDYFDVVAFTHLDRDHIQGFSHFFWLEHAKKYQDDERIKINDMWVPAAVITEEGPDCDEAKILQKEARHRLEKGKGIRVFSRPERLEKWLNDRGISLNDRANLITDAGRLVPGYKKTDAGGVEFFIHSPHAKRLDDGGIEDRNGDCLVFQARFRVAGTDTDVLMTGDAKHETWDEVVDITKAHKNDERLHWDIYKLPHHCSYTAIGPEKSTDASPNKTPPTDQVKWLCEEQGAERCIVISPSDPVPAKGTKKDKDIQPPHREAANYYEQDVVDPKDGQFLVTMSEPSEEKPKPIVIEIGSKGAIKKIAGASGFGIVTGSASPRAGRW
ncbi:MAG: hypothetical protein ABJ388_00245 [Alphaproteobacteria bacterium]|uniref:hypothetical protein n=1 Tax=Roseibium sp. TaxID=1936156 RepID=UPI00326CFA76